MTYGTLIAHGPENYRLDPHGDMSYFVKIKTEDNRSVTFWGLDLERALHQSKTQPRVGDLIGVWHRGERAVTVNRREYDAEGRVVGERPIQTHRNDWTVEAKSFFQARKQLADLIRSETTDPHRATAQHPELSGTFAALKASELIARRTRADPYDQKRWMAMTRRTLADEIERGEPLYAPALRDKPRSTDRRPLEPIAGPVR